MTVINHNVLSRAVGVELDAQVPAPHTPGEETRRIDGGRTSRRGLGSRGVQNVRVPGNDVHGRHGVPESVGEYTPHQ